jgi:uncharacterized protein YaaN involved in tellurite resistance
MTKEIEKLKKENAELKDDIKFMEEENEKLVRRYEKLKDDIELKELGKEIERLKDLFYAKQNEILEKEKEKFRKNK